MATAIRSHVNPFMYRYLNSCCKRSSSTVWIARSISSRQPNRRLLCPAQFTLILGFFVSCEIFFRQAHVFTPPSKAKRATSIPAHSPLSCYSLNSKGADILFSLDFSKTTTSCFNFTISAVLPFLRIFSICNTISGVM